jgi:hypothetical protein
VATNPLGAPLPGPLQAGQGIGSSQRPVIRETIRSGACGVGRYNPRGEDTLRSTTVVTESINVILRNLGELPESPEVRELRGKAIGYMNEATLWKNSKPSVEKREALMKEVLAFHVAVNKLAGAGRR